jgi:ABC-type dipeptide/oligopeptide/nickel transport system permease component
MTAETMHAPPRRWLASPWLPYLGRRLLRFVLSLWVLVTFSFFMLHLVPGDPVRAALGNKASPIVVANERARLGLDDSMLTQYVNFLTRLLQGNFGDSMQLREPVSDVITQRLPNTLMLAFLAFIVIMALAVPIGSLFAIRTQSSKRRGTELGFTSLTVVLAAIPDFVLAVGMVFVFSVSTNLLPIAGKDGLSSYIIPLAALSLGPAAALARIVRVEMLGVLNEDFMRTGRAKRLVPWRLYIRHALPNALTATLTISGLLLSGLIAGTVIVESIMAWPGLGPTLVKSIIGKDYPMVQGIVLVYGGLILVINLTVDVLLAAADPRAALENR